MLEAIVVMFLKLQNCSFALPFSPSLPKDSILKSISSTEKEAYSRFGGRRVGVGMVVQSRAWNCEWGEESLCAG